MIAPILVIFMLKCFNVGGRPAGGRVTAEERRVALSAILRTVQKNNCF